MQNIFSIKVFACPVKYNSSNFQNLIIYKAYMDIIRDYLVL